MVEGYNCTINGYYPQKTDYTTDNYDTEKVKERVKKGSVNNKSFGKKVLSCPSTVAAREVDYKHRPILPRWKPDMKFTQAYTREVV